MHKTLQRTLKTSSLSLLLSSTILASASAGQFGVSPVVGTLGIGLELDYAVNDYLSARLQTNQFSHGHDFEEDDINYEGDLDLSSYGLLLDWHPFSGAFRITGGVYNNDNEAKGVATDPGLVTYEIGRATYRSLPTGPLVLDVKVELGKSTAGYLGLGWGHCPTNRGDCCGPSKWA